MAGLQRTLLSLTDPDLAPDSIDGVTLIGIVVTADYPFDPGHTSAADLATYETTASSYTRLAGTVAVTTDTVQNGVFVALESVTAGTDLSDEPAQGGIGWVLPGASDAARKYVGFSDDVSGSGNASYSPTYDSGFYDESAADTLTVSVDGGAP